MKALILTSFILFAPSAALAKTFVCDVKSTARYDAGAFKAIPNETNWLDLIRVVTFDEDTGVFRYGSENAWQQFPMKVLQRGSESNSTLAVSSLQGVASHVLNTLRIRTWEEGAPFVWDNNGDLFAGGCKAYGN